MSRYLASFFKVVSRYVAGYFHRSLSPVLTVLLFSRFLLYPFVLGLFVKN